MDYNKKAIEMHAKWQGKIEVVPRCEINGRDDLSVAYTPGVARPCVEIRDNPDLSYTYTRRGNMVAVISDGSAVLGLGNIGALAAMPVMEGKCVLFKRFGGVDAFPIVLNTQDTDEIVKTVAAIAPSFGGINLEDISAPRCFEVEERLKSMLDIPVFHDDQHGTAVVVLAAVLNSLRLTGKRIEDFKICLSGPGAAGTAITELLIKCGVKEVILSDKDGIIYDGKEGLDFKKRELAKITNFSKIKGGLKEAIAGADVFVGVSAPRILTEDMIKTMADKAVVFAMANPEPEIYPDKALAAGAFIAGTGRSDFPNQVNNVLAFPGIFKGALKVRAKAISDNMKIAAAKALASLISDEEIRPDYVLPSSLDPRAADAVADAVAAAAVKEGLNRI